MDAIILAAGKGTRLRPHTLTTPKPLLPVQGRPILDHILGALPPIDRLVVVVNYLAEQIEAHLKTQSHIANWVTVLQTEPRGTGDALLSCRDHVTAERILVLNGDDLIGRDDLARFVTVPMGILVHAVNDPASYGIVTQRPDGTLKSIVEKPEGLTSPQLANIGGYIFPHIVFDLTLPLSPRGEYEITDAVAQLALGGEFHVVEAHRWIPIGNIPEWEAANDPNLILG